MTTTREEFLIQMYERLWDNIGRHINISWQSITTVFTATAALALSEKGVVNFDVAATLVLIVCGWAICHFYDSAAWYNRNLLIIANIERQFLAATDSKEIHFYFTKHRDAKLINHFKLQYGLVLSIGLLVLGYHFATRVLPGLGQPRSFFEWSRAVPYVVFVVGVIGVWIVRHACITKYSILKEQSPGKTVTSPPPVRTPVTTGST